MGICPFDLILEEEYTLDSSMNQAFTKKTIFCLQNIDPHLFNANNNA